MAKIPDAATLADRPALITGGGGFQAARPPDIQRLPSDAEGFASLAQSTGRAAEMLAGLHEKERERDDALAATNAINELKQASVDLTAGEQDGFRNKVRGLGATDEAKTGYTSKFNDASKRIRESLKSERARQRFDMEQGTVALHFSGELATHIAKERDKAEEDQLRVTLETEKRWASAAGNDPMALDMGLMRMDNEISAFGERRGLSKERIADMKGDARSAIYVSAIMAQRLSDPVGALQTYQRVSQDLNIEQRVKIEESVFADAAPVIAADLLRQETITTVASNETEARAIVDAAARFGKKATVTLPSNDARQGELGVLKRPDGGISTELSITVTDERLNGGQPTNIPLLVKGQTGVDDLLKGAEPNRAQVDRAVDRAAERVKGGASLPGYNSIEEAETAAKSRTTEEKTSYITGATGTPFDALPPDQKLKVLGLAHTQAEQGMAQLRQGLQLRARDAEAALERGQPAPHAPTRTELVTAFGPERGEAMDRELANAKTFGDAYTQVASAPRSEQQAILAKMAPDPNAEGYADAVRRYEQMAGVIDRVRKEQDQDPAGYVLTQSPARQRVLKGLDSPDVRSTYERFVMAQDDQKMAPEDKANAARAYASATVAEQSRLGIANPQILPKAMIDSIVQRFSAPPREGENPVNVMRGMVDQWGPYWPAVGKQLKGKLPPEMEVIGLGVLAEGEALLSETMRIKPEALRQGLAEPDVKDIRERVRSAMEPLQRSLAWQSGGISTYDNYADSVEKVATALVQKGMKPKEAATKAFESLAGFKYEFEDTWRVPKTALGGGITARTMREGAEAIKRDIASDKPVLGEKVPLAVPAVQGAVRPEDADRQWRDTIQANGFWVTSPGDGGLTLYVKSGLGAQPVLGADGQPVRRSWDQLSGIGRSVSAATFSDVARGNKINRPTPNPQPERPPARTNSMIGVRG